MTGKTTPRLGLGLLLLAFGLPACAPGYLELGGLGPVLAVGGEKVLPTRQEVSTSTSGIKPVPSASVLEEASPTPSPASPSALPSARPEVVAGDRPTSPSPTPANTARAEAVASDAAASPIADAGATPEATASGAN